MILARLLDVNELPNYQICDAFPIGISILQGGQYNNFQGHYYVPVQLQPQQQRLSSNPQHINSLSKFKKPQQQNKLNKSKIVTYQIIVNSQVQMLVVLDLHQFKPISKMLII